MVVVDVSLNLVFPGVLRDECHRGSLLIVAIMDIAKTGERDSDENAGSVTSRMDWID